MSATDALYVLPAWEVDLLAAGLAAEYAPAPDSPEPTPARTDPHQLAKELDRIG